jgi:hypothetical protein
VERLHGLIGAVRRRWFAAAALRITGLACIAAAVPLLAALGVFWIVQPSGRALLALAGAAALLSLAAALASVWRIERRPDDVRVARFIEERVADLPGGGPMDDCLVSAVAPSIRATDVPATLRTLVAEAASRRLGAIDAAMIVPPERLRRAAGIAAVGAIVLALTLVVGLPALSLSLQTARLTFFPQSVSVDVLPGDTRIVAGRSLTVRAKVHAGGEPIDDVAPNLVVSAGDAQRTVPMVRSGDGFVFEFESVDRSFDYKVTAGAAVSEAYAVTALFPPKVARIDLEYHYPAFSRLSPRTQEDAGDIYAPAGTRVRVRIHADKPVASGALALSKTSPAVRVAGSQVLEADVLVKGDDAYRISLVDVDGLRADDDSEYFIRVMEDRPPDVRILRPAGDQGITPLQEIGIEARAEDDYGVASLDLVYSVAGGAERRVPFARLSGSETERSGAHLLAAEELNVRPGDVIAYYAVARDVARGRPSTEVKSDLFFLEVKPFNEEFVAAQSQAGAGMPGDPQIEALIQAQKDILNATWNIERRAAAGRSSEDLQAIAKAQAELKARVDRLLAGARSGRGRSPLVQRQLGQMPAAQGGRGNPVAEAADAMGRAVEQLVSERTRDAITHEMAALHGLLQAQAEVRRRQIAQQQGRGGGGGGNRQSQDLSALFDKELQRQQQTNYEQRSQVEERQSEQQNADQAWLDRIRDLARRQEALNRQQRELERLQADERKRQLERLAREQEELQRETEALSRQMNTQSGQRGQQQQSQQQGQQQGQQSQQQAGQQSQGQQGGQGSAAARGAIDQMQRAADEMRRENSQAAAESGQRAAQQLRDLEDRMRGGGADARQRAAADLQSEAQQIAQEQRRIAAEAGRMEQGGEAGNTDARRRLAADKDRLADRVDNLQREAQRLGEQPAKPGAGGSGETARAREAAGRLQKEQLGERMRQAAGQLREGTAAPSATAEQQVAQALDGIVETLGGAASAEARGLAEQLDRSRQTRERLEALEAQLREAEARGDEANAAKMREQLRQELGRARETFGRDSGASRARDGARGGTPEQQEHSRSAPGTEAFKQDRSGWESLKQDVDRTLEQHDADVSRRLAKVIGDERLNGGGSERIPEQYRRLVAKYYESLARVKK